MNIYSQQEVKQKTNQVIQRVLQLQQHRAAGIHPAYSLLWKTIEGLMMAGGKRLRPYLTYIGYAMWAESNNDEIFTIAASQEFLHFSLLIHDDIIDRDTVRYGQKNISGKYEAVYAQAADDSSHFANGAAIMAGDLALSQAYDLISQAGFSAEQKSTAIHHLSQSIFHVAGGELLDMEAAFRQPSADYFTIARHKTASYSFVGPLLMGANLAAAPQTAFEYLEDFGLHLGIAYQLADDLLGVYGDEQSIGKPVISDLREGKKTHLFELIQHLSNESDQRYFSQAWGSSSATIENLERVRQIGIDCGAKTKVEELMREYAHKALVALTGLPLTEERLEPLRSLADKAINRTT